MKRVTLKRRWCIGLGLILFLLLVFCTFQLRREGEVQFQIIRVRDVRLGVQAVTVRMENKSNRPVTYASLDGKTPMVIVSSGGFVIGGATGVVLEPSQSVEGTGEGWFFGVLSNQVINWGNPRVLVDYHYGPPDEQDTSLYGSAPARWDRIMKAVKKLAGADSQMKRWETNLPLVYPPKWGATRPIPPPSTNSITIAR